MRRKEILIGIGIMTALTWGCKVTQTTALPPIQPPAAYTDSTGTDSTSIGDKPWRQLFTDVKLTQLIDSALHNNRDLLRAIQQVEIARSRFYIRKVATLPVVTAQASAGFDKYGNYTQNGVGNFDTNLSANINNKQHIPYPITPDYFLGLRSIWEIDLWGRLSNLKKAAYSRYLASQKGVHLLQTRLVADVASSYYELMSLDNELNIIRNNIVLQDSALQIVQVFKQAGRANELAVQQFRAQLLNTRGLEGQKLQQIVETKSQLSFLQGRYPQEVERDTALLALPLPGAIAAGVPMQLLRRRPDVQQAELELVANSAELLSARATLLPSLTLTPYVGLNSFRVPQLPTIGSVTYGLLGSFAGPLIYQGAIRRNINIAGATRLDAYYAWEQTVLNAVREVVNSLSAIQNLQNVYTLKLEEVQTLRAAVETSNLLYRTNYASYLEVITAQRNVLDAELELIDRKREIMLSVVELYRALGGGWQ